MTYEILITPTALNDIHSSIQFYNTKVNNLGFDFLDEVETNLTTIENTPLAFAEKYHNVRAKVLKRFPYIILYQVQLNQIQILRIFNTYQKPYWE